METDTTLDGHVRRQKKQKLRERGERETRKMSIHADDLKQKKKGGGKNTNLGF